MNGLIKRIALGQARHLLTAVAGALAAKGVIDESMVEPAVGILIYAAGAGLSMLDKKGK